MSLEDALGFGRGAWQDLVDACAVPSPFMTWEWHRAWLDSALPERREASEALVIPDAGGGLRAVFPFVLLRTSVGGASVTALTWAIGDLGCPDHCELLARSEADVRAVAQVVGALEWDMVRLPNVPEAAPNVDSLVDALETCGYTARERVLWDCPFLDLPESWNEYLSTLTATRRQTIRRKERSLTRRHEVVLTEYEGDRVEEGMNRLCNLHRQRWEGGGAFQDQQVEALHRRFTPLLTARGDLWLVTLDLDGVPAAAWYGFALGDTVFFYQSGRDLKWERDGVGSVLMGMMIRRAIERGFRRFDFLRGEEPYKAQWTTSQRESHERVIFRPGLRGKWLRCLYWPRELKSRLRARRARRARRATARSPGARAGGQDAKSASGEGSAEPAGQE